MWKKSTSNNIAVLLFSYLCACINQIMYNLLYTISSKHKYYLGSGLYSKYSRICNVPVKAVMIKLQFVIVRIILL